MFDSALRTALAIAAQTRRRLLAASRGTGLDPLLYFARTRPILHTADALFARVLRDLQLYGYATGGADVLAPLVPPEQIGPSQELPIAQVLADPFDPEPVGYRLVGLDHAADYLRSLNAVTTGEWEALDNGARRTAFTVARDTTREAAEKVRGVMVQSVEEGLTFQEARPLLRDALETSPVGDAQIETTYRTYYGKAQAAGQLKILENPMVADEFPYVKYSATRDARTRPEHRYMEANGLDGTGVYRADDPTIIKFWAPWAWNCRCNCFAISVEAAARYGVREAIEWLRTGEPPTVPEYVDPPPFDLPKGWVPVSEGLAA